MLAVSGIDEIEQSTGKLLGTIVFRPKIAFRTRWVESLRSLIGAGSAARTIPTDITKPLTQTNWRWISHSGIA